MAITVTLTKEQFKAIAAESETFLAIYLNAMDNDQALENLNITQANNPPLTYQPWFDCIKNCSGNKIQAIKDVRSVASGYAPGGVLGATITKPPIDPSWGCGDLTGLKDAKDFVEKFWDRYWQTPSLAGYNYGTTPVPQATGGIVGAVNKAFGSGNNNAP